MSQGYADDEVRALVSDSFRRDMEKIARLGRLRDVPMIFSGYPTHAYEEVEQTAAAWDIPYVDFRPIFAARFTRKEQFLGPDGCHCNTAGYRLMAEVLAEQVEEVLGLDLPHSPATRIELRPEVSGPGFVPGPRDRPLTPEERTAPDGPGQDGPPPPSDGAPIGPGGRDGAAPG